MVGVAEVSVVEEPHVSHIEHLVVRASEELGEVLAGLEKISEPDHCREVTVSSLQELPSQFHLISLLLVGCLYSDRLFLEPTDRVSDGLYLLALISLMAWRPIRGVDLLESANCLEI